jgi:hypothetical protein
MDEISFGIGRFSDEFEVCIYRAWALGGLLWFWLLPPADVCFEAYTTRRA